MGANLHSTVSTCQPPLHCAAYSEIGRHSQQGMHLHVDDRFLTAQARCMGMQKAFAHA